MRRWLLIVAAALWVAASPPAQRASAEALTDAPPLPVAPSFAEGDVVAFGDVAQLRGWLPEAFWEKRSFFFYEGMQLEIGPVQRDYAPPEVYRAATRANRGRAKLGRDGILEGYVAGQPFPIDEISCSDADAGTKHIWNFVHRWQGFGAKASFRYAYLDRGELLPLYYQGTTSAWLLKHRPEPQFAGQGGDVFEDERRMMVIGFEVDAPSQAKGTRTLTYRYAASFGPPDVAPPEDTWLYSRSVRRVRKISQNQRSAAVAGTDFSFDDLFTFSGLPAQYDWQCIGEARLLAPMNTTRLGYPYTAAEGEASFGPTGLSYANDRWELREAIGLEMTPRDPEHPYSRKTLWLDRQTMQPLYSFAYDRAGALWKIIHHNHRWSEDALGEETAQGWYPGWDSVPRPRDLRVVSDSIANVQTGTGNRLDFWNSHGTAPELRELRRYIDIQRLRSGR